MTREFPVNTKIKEQANANRGIYRLTDNFFRYARMGRWIGKTTVRDTKAPGGSRIAETEIDLLCVDGSEKEYLVGECKFKGHPFSYSEYLDMTAKLSPLKENAVFHYALFSESGFDEKIRSIARKEGLLLYSLPEIVGGRPIQEILSKDARDVNLLQSRSLSRCPNILQ